MEGEREVWRSQGWIVFLFLSPTRRLKASGYCPLPRKLHVELVRVDNHSPAAVAISTHRSGSSIRPQLIHPGPISWSDPEHLVKTQWPGRQDPIWETGKEDFRRMCRVATEIALR